MTTTAPPALDDARPALRGQNLIRLEWIARQLRREPGEDADVAPLADLHQALAAAGDSAGPVLVDPRFGSWLGRLIRLIERRAPQILPDGAFRASCAEAGAFAAAARLLACRDGRPAAPDTRVRIGPAGRTWLPGAGVVIVFPAGLAGLAAVVRATSDGDPEVVLPGTVGRPPRARLEAEDVPAPGLVVADGGPVLPAACREHPLLAVGPPVVAVQHGTSDLLAGGVPGIAVVPREADAAIRTAHALAAAAHLAVVLSPASAASSPLARHTAPPPRLTEVCEAGQVRRLLALRAWLRELHAPGTTMVDEVLTAVGEWLVAADDPDADAIGLLGVLREAGLLRAGSLPDDPVRRGSSGPPSWRAAWRRAGGRWRVPHPVTRRLAADSGELASILAELGCPNGIEVNLLGDQRLRADPSMDHLSLMFVREPGRYAQLADSLGAAAGGEARRLLLGHCAYIEQRFADAVGAYAQLLREHPNDADLWRDLTFALRHLGLPEVGQTWLFRPQEVVTRASACYPDAETLNRLLPLAAGRASWSGAARFAIGILEWVGHDPDYG